MLTLKQVNDTIIELFSEASVLSTENTYQKIGDKTILVISFHNIILEDVNITHTKLIFDVNEERSGLSTNNFRYLYDINCHYKSINFKEDDLDDFSDKLYDIFINYKFGDNIKGLDEFQFSTTDINNYLFNKNIQNSVLEIKYNPKFNITSCADMTFDFDVYITQTKIYISLKENNGIIYCYIRNGEDTKDVEFENMKKIGIKIAIELFV